MLRDRLLTSLLLIAAIVSLLWLDVKHPLLGIDGLWLLPLLLFFTLGTAFDLATMLRASGRAVEPGWVIGAAGLVAVSAYVPSLWPLSGQAYPSNCPLGGPGWLVAGTIAAIFLLLFREIVNYRSGGGSLERTLGGVFASVYVGAPMGLLVLIRQTGSSPVDAGGLGGAAAWGLAAMVAVIAVTKSGDIGAYFTGKSIGRHKMIPRLSPGKTWEGAVGGVVTAILVSYACFYYLIPSVADTAQPPPWWGPIVFGTVCAVTGMIGDLAESLVKRETGVKDSGKWLPGLGGVWDVTDSLIGAVMPAWIMLAAGLAGS
ncbi:MAG: phosphatidate cytidylyltransferase [Planctomycetaceae bacterium]